MIPRPRIALPFAIALLSLLIARPCAAQVFERTDTQKEIEVGREIARQTEAHTPLSRNRAMQERVRRIGKALTDSMPTRAYPFEFKVLADPEYNAFCLPGGFMYVDEGLLARLPDDSALAWVMGHEITHAAHRHWAHQMQKTSRDAAIGILFDVFTKSNLGSQQVALLNLRYSRENETDADNNGIELMWAAGYDPQGALAATAIMEEMEKGSHVPHYLRTHPPAKDRGKRLEKWIADNKDRPRPTAVASATKAAETAPPAPAPAEAAPARAASAPQTPGVSPATPPPSLAAPSPLTNPWFPLAVGNVWTYQVTGPGSRSAYSLRVSASVPAEKGAAYRVLTILGKDREIPCLMQADADTVLRRNRPTAPDSAWKLEYTMKPDRDHPIEVEGAIFTLLDPETVETPCGIFKDVLKLRRKTSRYTVDLWFARSVGLVKTACAETGITETLTAYHLEKSTEK